MPDKITKGEELFLKTLGEINDNKDIDYTERLFGLFLIAATVILILVAVFLGI